MTDREFLEQLHTQLSNHLVLPAAQTQAAVAPVSGTLSSMSPKVQFGPGIANFRVIHAPGDVHLEWVSDKDVNVAVGGLTFTAPPQWSAFVHTEGELIVTVSALGSGTLWMSA